MIEIPCRGLRCKHLQCFDLNSFYFVNKKFKHNSQYLCPICNKACSSAKLYIDPIMACILFTVESNIDVIYLHRNGIFQTSNALQKTMANLHKKAGVVVDLCSDDEEESVSRAMDSSTATTMSIIKNQWHVASFSALAEKLISNDNRGQQQEKVTCIEEVSRVRLTDLLFFLNNAPAAVFQSFSKTYIGFYEKLVCS